MLPNLIIAGVPKAGTTSLFRALAAHPDIFGSSAKETQYFRPLLDGGELAPVEEYERYFSGCGNESHRLEATPEYFYGGQRLIDEMKALLGEMRIVLLFREPRSRLVSFYRFKKAHMHLPADITIEEYVEACESVPNDQRLARHRSAFTGIEGSYYDDYLPPWLRSFEDSLQIIFFDDLIADPDGVLHRLAEWLDIDPAGFAEGGLAQANRTTQFRWAPLQRLALWAAPRAEGFSQRHPRIYDRLVATYYTLNGRSSIERLPDHTAAHLDQLFLPHKRRLSQQLAERGYFVFPEWLPRPIDPTPGLEPPDDASSLRESATDDE